MSGTRSEKLQTGSKAHDYRPNFHATKNDIYGPKIV